MGCWCSRPFSIEIVDKGPRVAFAASVFVSPSGAAPTRSYAGTPFNITNAPSGEYTIRLCELKQSYMPPMGTNRKSMQLHRKDRRGSFVALRPTEQPRYKAFESKRFRALFGESVDPSPEPIEKEDVPVYTRLPLSLGVNAYSAPMVLAHPA